MNKLYKYNNRSKNKAFTFIEVLTSLALIAVTLPFIMGAITQSTKLTTMASNQLTATTLAQSKLNQLVADGTWESSDSHGNFEEDYPEQTQYEKFTWEFETTNHEEKQSLKHIAITILWQHQNKSHSLKLSTTIFDPDNS